MVSSLALLIHVLGNNHLHGSQNHYPERTSLRSSSPSPILCHLKVLILMDCHCKSQLVSILAM